MTIQGNYKTPTLPPLTPPARSERPSTTATNPVRPAADDATTPAPVAPSGLLGHHVDTTA
ncbi:MAG TPA: hypothetical protein VEI25_12455 [Paraburkholderia sp.]|nr:hypothetical protein [Paraburkholderia sp.]